tara:strand:+ start:456 stop:842 length:387 start_codon:yes stop_codon:yes gene_type:complete
MSSEYVDENGAFHKNWGLVEGRHEIPNVDGYIFGTIEDVLDFDDLQAQADLWASQLFDWFFDAKDMDKLNPYLDTEEGVDWGINLYVTGLTSALIALIGSFAYWQLAGITFWHYNRDTGEYVPQTWKY